MFLTYHWCTDRAWPLKKHLKNDLKSDLKMSRFLTCFLAKNVFHFLWRLFNSTCPSEILRIDIPHFDPFLTPIFTPFSTPFSTSQIDTFIPCSLSATYSVEDRPFQDPSNIHTKMGSKKVLKIHDFYMIFTCFLPYFYMIFTRPL